MLVFSDFRPKKLQIKGNREKNKDNPLRILRIALYQYLRRYECLKMIKK